MADQNSNPTPGQDPAEQDTALLNMLRDDPELMMKFFVNFFEAFTHCVEPEGYHKISKKLKEALNEESDKATSTTEATQAPLASNDSDAVPFNAKKFLWDSAGVYRIDLDNTGAPVPDPDWPAGFRFIKVDQPEGEKYFQLFQSERDAMIVDSTDPQSRDFGLPEFDAGFGADDGHYVYRFNRKYRFGPKAYDVEGKYLSKLWYSDTAKYNYAEHALMGNRITLQWSEDESKNTKAEKRPLTLENGGSLTYGEINALGGDFFATYSPICTGNSFSDQCNLFIQAFETLSKSPRAKKEAHDIEVIVQPEVDAISKATDDGTKTADTSDIYKKLDGTINKDHMEDKRLDDATRRPDGPSYMAIAQLNLDHFGADGHTAYNAGHHTAMLTASNGNLELGYCMNAFADHFLGDAFASGHFRTPRRKLHGSSDNVQKAVDVISKIVLGHTRWGIAAALLKEIFNPFSSVYAAWSTCAPDFCAKFMHDEDNMKGLWVSNKRPKGPDVWQAFGDSKLFDPHNELNCKFMLQALQASANEVYEAYNNGPNAPIKDVADFAVWEIAPSTALPGQNHQPLFNQDGWYRSDINDPQCTTYVDPSKWDYKLLSIDLLRSDYFANLK